MRCGFEVRNVDRIPHGVYAPVVRRYCELLWEVFGGRLVSVMLFGSVARGDWGRDSDIDFVVVVEGWEGVPVWERVRELGRVKELLERSVEYGEALRRGFWPVVQNYPLSVEEAGRFNMVYLDALLDGVILYDRGASWRGCLARLGRGC